ncbi:uncharacterized protein LOC120196502 [Hibiscus syriacus]|uniref:uncharacterized protein LOC120196502 n=1 Tax=Hibiscus syriacus TaxID=106335 RepID=UPI001921E57F|nr:uncharacterized protein LOC120196502 [Hibiscus syriacus]
MNFLLKINTKLKGISSRLAIEKTPSIPIDSKVPTIILGIDVSHGSPRQYDIPLIAAMIEDLNALVKQGQEESSPPKWWETQENQITTLESRMSTNQGYVEELLKILTSRNGEQENFTDEQDDRPIAYFSKALSPRHVALSIYEREYLVILLAVSKWSHFLENNPFVIKIDHEPLKKGKSNVVADALSRQWKDQGQCLAMGTTLIISSWVQDVEGSYKEDLLAIEWIYILTVNPNDDPKWKYSKGILRFKERVYIGTAGALGLQVLQTMHDSPHGGHSGTQATY